jgi:hypothetical protein
MLNSTNAVKQLLIIRVRAFGGRAGTHLDRRRAPVDSFVLKTQPSQAASHSARDDRACLKCET